MKSVLLSIKPKFCELIASGEKTVEIRKNCPKIDVPFKCYIYCTRNELKIYGDGKYYVTDNSNILNEEAQKGFEKTSGMRKWNGKVIGEFVCDDIDKIAVFNNILYCVNNTQANKLKQACLTIEDIKAYLGIKNSGYAWHISDLAIYDKPKEISEFGLTRPPQSWCYVEELEE